MREMRPLLLPKIVASKRSPNNSSEDLAAHPSSSLYSLDSLHSASDCSSPITPTFSMRHTRCPSSNSSTSVGSSSSTYEHVEGTQSSSKFSLTKLDENDEDFHGSEDDFVLLDDRPSPCLCDVDVCSHSEYAYDCPPVVIPRSPDYDLSDGFFGDDSDHASLHLSKRRRSGESPIENLAIRLEHRLPSAWSRKLRERKRTSFGVGSRSAGPSLTATRSSSLTSTAPALHQSEVNLASAVAQSIQKDSEETAPASPVNIVQRELEYEPIDRRAMASTPLLPPSMLSHREENDTPLQSPLQSPTIADSKTFSIASAPVDTPQLPGLPSPPLSTKHSMSSMRVSRPGHTVTASDIPPIKIAESDDEWSMKLGHANFTIYPEPYMPEVCDSASCRQLFADWEQARCNFTKHQVRTGEHYGVTSKTYDLSGQKWAEIDAEWKKYYDAAVTAAAERGEETTASSPVEPAPLIKMPSLNDPQSEGKFPKLGDEDIVGPMVQIAAQLQPKQSKKSTLLKFLNEMKFPGAILGKSSLGKATTT